MQKELIEKPGSYGIHFQVPLIKPSNLTRVARWIPKKLERTHMT